MPVERSAVRQLRRAFFSLQPGQIDAHKFLTFVWHMTFAMFCHSTLKILQKKMSLTFEVPWSRIQKIFHMPLFCWQSYLIMRHQDKNDINTWSRLALLHFDHFWHPSLTHVAELWFLVTVNKSAPFQLYTWQVSNITMKLILIPSLALLGLVSLSRSVPVELGRLKREGKRFPL